MQRRAACIPPQAVAGLIVVHRMTIFRALSSPMVCLAVVSTTSMIVSWTVPCPFLGIGAPSEEYAFVGVMVL